MPNQTQSNQHPSVDVHQVEAYFNQMAQSWYENATPTSAIHHHVAFLAGVKPGMRVLDIGCGTGVMVAAYSDAQAKQIVGVDVSSNMIEYARMRFADDASVCFECCDITKYATDEPFDVAVIYNAYPHFADKQALANAVAGLLKDGGRFLVAHGKGRDDINDHHKDVPEDVTSHLLEARWECESWRHLFAVDTLVDTCDFYCFGGVKK